MRLLALILLLVACDGGTSPPTPVPVADLALAGPSLVVSPLVAAFDGPYKETIFNVEGRGFDGPNRLPWDHVGPGLFYFLSIDGPLDGRDVDRHAYKFIGNTSGQLTVDLLEPTIRGRSYKLCMDLALSGVPPESVCGDWILFAP